MTIMPNVNKINGPEDICDNFKMSALVENTCVSVYKYLTLTVYYRTPKCSILMRVLEFSTTAVLTEIQTMGYY